MEIDQIRRKLTALENKQRVNMSNTSLEAKCLKNEGSTLKATSGAITSNVVIKAPNIPDDLVQKIQKIDDIDEDMTELSKSVAQNTLDISGKADKEHTHELKDITDYKAYDDTEVRTLIEGKADKSHTHEEITTNTTNITQIKKSISTIETDLAGKSSIYHYHKFSAITEYRETLINLIYPIGSIYTSMTSTNPKTVFGIGTWTQIVDRFLYCTTDSKKTGGNQIHSHRYGFRVPVYYGAFCDDDTLV